MNKQTLRRMVGGGLFAAIIVVLQLIGGGIRFGTFSISLVLVPIVVGTAVYGWQMGGWLGLVFGAAVLLSGDANLFMTINPAGTIATVLVKGIACGLAAGGLGRFVVPHCRRRLVYDEHLLLRGLGMIWRRAQGEILSCGAMGNAV